MTTSAFCVNSLINAGDNVAAAALKGAVQSELHSTLLHGSSKCSLTPKFADSSIQAASVVTATPGNGLAPAPQVSGANMYHLPAADQNTSYASPWFYSADHHTYSSMSMPMPAVADEFDNSAYHYSMGAPKNFETGLMAASGGGFYSIGRHQAYDRYPNHANSMYHHPSAVSHAGAIPVSLTAASSLSTKYITSDSGGGGGGGTSPHATQHTLLEEKSKFVGSSTYENFNCPKETIGSSKTASSQPRAAEISPPYPTESSSGSPAPVSNSKGSPSSETKENDAGDNGEGKITSLFLERLS